MIPGKYVGAILGVFALAAAAAFGIQTFGNTTFGATVCNVFQGCTGTSTIPTNYVLLGNTTNRITAVATSSLGLGTGTVTSIATTYPVTGGTITTSGTIALAFGTTTANTWSALQTFTNGFISSSSSTVNALLTALNASTTNLSVGTSLFIPNSASQTAPGAGQIAEDTTDKQLILNAAVFDQRRFLTFSYATTTTWTGTTTMQLGPAPAGFTYTQASCYTDAGTLQTLFKYAATLVVPEIVASTTAGVVPFTSNNTPATGNTLTVNAGGAASSPTQITCTATATITGT